MIGKARLDRCRPQRGAALSGGAGMGVGQPLLVEAAQIPFDLKPDFEVDLAVRQLCDLFLENLPGREMKRSAVGEIFVAQYPANSRRPGQDPESIWVGDDDQIGGAGHLVQPHAAAAHEGAEHPPARGIERKGRDIDDIAVAQRGKKHRNGDHFCADMAMRVGPGHTDHPHAVLGHAATDLFRQRRLIVGP